MKVACPSCNSNLNIADGKIPPGGARIKCPTCQNVFPVKPAAAAGAVPLPGAAAPAPRAGAVPLPGLSAARPAAMSHQEEPTRVSDAPGMPLDEAGPTHTGPAGARGGAVPLPGGYEPSLVGGDVRTQPAAAAARGAGARGGAVPLPGGAGNYQPTTTGPAYAPPPAEPTHIGGLPDGGLELDDPTAPPTRRAPPPQPDFDDPDLPSPAGGAGGGFEFEDLPSPAGATNTGFELEDAPPPPPPPARAAKGRAAPPEPRFDDLPSPAEDNLPSPADGDLPSPAGPPGGLAFDFADAPAPAAPPPAPAFNPSASFGEVDLGGGGGGDGLEFDPTAPAKQDDLEADLSAPLPPAKPTGPADGMAMLGFIDQQAKDAGIKDAPRARRFHIKRRSGKVFGPFEEAVVAKMLEDGQLLGNEEVSLDSESWQPIGAEPAFQGAIAKLMESPSKTMATPGGTADGPPVLGAGQAASMDRLKQLYEGRMAAVAVVESKNPIPIKVRLPLIIGGALAVLLVGVGAFMGTTRYGVFGLKVLFPAKVKAGSKEFAELAKARTALLKDTWGSYQEAKQAVLNTLKVKEYPEARAVWCQTIFHLARKYQAATPPEVTQAHEALEAIELLGKKHVEVLKAQAGSALVKQQAQAALAALNDALARAENQKDLELYLLRAEAFALNKQVPQALADLKVVLDKDKAQARALHLAGMLHLRQNETDLALGRFQEAVKADPDHLASEAQEVAIQLLIRKDVAKAQAGLDKLLTEEAKKKLAPSELGLAMALKGELLLGQFKYKEATEVFDAALKVDPGGAAIKYGYGKAAMAGHDLEKALGYFKDAYNTEPGNLDYVDGYLSALVARGKMEDAMNVVRSANSRFPGNARLAFFAARVDDVLDRAKDAEANYLRAISADPNLVEANLYLARLYLRFRRLKDAKPQLETAASKAPNNPLVRLGLGELSLAENDLDRAEKEFTSVTKIDPNLADGYLGLSLVALQSDRLELAGQMADKALQLNPRVRGGRLQRGTTLWKLGRHDDAQRELEQGRIEDPGSIELVVTLGAVQLDRGALNDANSTLAQALKAEPANSEANFYMARVKNRKAEHSQAIEHMKKALEHGGRRAEFNYWMGRIYQDARKVNEAQEQWKLALQIDPKNVDTLEALGRMYLDRNNVKQSVLYFEKALEVDPLRHAVRAAIGDAYATAERWDDAIKSYHRAIEAAPELPTVHFRLAQAYFERKKYTEAIEWFKKATVKDPENPTAYLNLGWAYKEKKQKPQAIAAFKQYLAKKPDAENKQEIQDQIDYLSQER